MTAAATPNTPTRADWAWPSKPPPPPLAVTQFMAAPPSSPLELQLLPPSAAAIAAAAAADLPAAASSQPWTVDPLRLQKLMMGSLSSPSDRLPAGNRDCVSDFGPFFDPKPLPSGWERCLDLKSGKVFIIKSDVIASKSGVAQRLGAWQQASQTIDTTHACWRPARSCDAAVQTDDQRADWTPSGVLGKSGFSPLISQSKGMPPSRKANAKAFGEVQQLSSPDRPSLCLDLDLRLSDSRSRLASEAPEVLSPPSLRAALSSAMKTRDSSGFSSLQIWNRQPAANVNKKPASIQEMVSESTMATAVCSKCLVYVLLKKSNPTCPRCFNPIILNCGAQTNSVNKRARLDLSPEDLSLSTDSSSR